METEIYVMTGSSLIDCNQFVSVNGYNSDFVPINCGVTQGSVLGQLPFLLYINIFIMKLDPTKCIILLMTQIFFIQVSQ